jgi:hypothetical protein
MTALISFSQILGHEVVASVKEVEAFLACHDQDRSGAVKVLFRYDDA